SRSAPHALRATAANNALDDDADNQSPGISTTPEYCHHPNLRSAQNEAGGFANVMFRPNRFAMAALCVSAFLLISCGSPDSATRNSKSADRNGDRGVLNLYIWANYFAPDTISSFEKRTGIKVRVAYYDTN